MSTNQDMTELERKQEEWDDLLHSHEMRNGIFASHRDALMRKFIGLSEQKRATDDPAVRADLSRQMSDIADSLGYSV